MKGKILFLIGTLFICQDELGRVVVIEDTDDNRNPDIGPLTKMGLARFLQDPVVLLTNKNYREATAANEKKLAESVKAQNSEFSKPENPGEL